MPSKSRRVLSVFIASPGDVVEERQVVGHVVDELNRGIGRRLGCHIDLLGWEETTAGFGRPQDKINAELDQADVFVGILHKRWGSPTGQAYDSGFEEEFERAIQRRRITRDSPEFLLAFKRVNDIADPGPQLRRVLEFKKRLIESKEVFFKEVDDPVDWERVVRQHLINIIFEHVGPETASPEVPRGSKTVVAKQHADTTPTEETEGTEGLPRPVVTITNRVRELIITPEISNLSDVADHLDQHEIARLHLASEAMVSRRITSGLFGVHETNVLYIYRRELAGAEAELLLLMRTLLADQNDVIPGWYWLQDMLTSSNLMLAADGDDSAIVRAGALRLLSDLQIRPDAQDATDSFFRGLLLASDSGVSSAALDYIESIASPDDLPLLESVADGEGVSDPARLTELIERLKVRANPGGGFAHWAPAERLPSAVEDEMTKKSPAIQSKVLRVGLTAQNPGLRRIAATELLRRDELGAAEADSLTKDRYRALRALGYCGLARLGSSVNLSEMKAALEPPKTPDGKSQQGLLSLFRTPDPEARHDRVEDPLRVEIEILKQRPKHDIEQELGWLDGQAAYRALLEAHLDDELDNVRLNLEDGFRPMREQWLSSIEKQFGVVGRSEMEELIRSLDQFIADRFAETALLALIGRAEVTDAVHAARYLNSQNQDTQLAAIQLLRAHGQDVHAPALRELAVQASGRVKAAAGAAAIVLAPEDTFQQFAESGDETLVALALSYAAKYRSDLVEHIWSLLNDDEGTIRAVAAGYCVSMLEDEDLEVLLNEYIAQDSYYYNIVTWLDRALYAPETVRTLYRSKLTAMLHEPRTAPRLLY